jgi:predicted DNA-binding protein
MKSKEILNKNVLRMEDAKLAKQTSISKQRGDTQILGRR